MRTAQKNPAKVDDGFKFEVGARYENMKGVYEVISVQKESMVIRWDDGDEVVTPIDLQRRIIDRMAFETNLRQQEKVKKQEKVSKKPKREKTPDPKGD